MHMLRHLIWQGVIYNIQFGEVHIPGEHNDKTDVLSKKTFTLGHVSGAAVHVFDQKNINIYLICHSQQITYISNVLAVRSNLIHSYRLE